MQQERELNGIVMQELDYGVMLLHLNRLIQDYDDFIRHVTRKRPALMQFLPANLNDDMAVENIENQYGFFVNELVMSCNIVYESNVRELKDLHTQFARMAMEEYNKNKPVSKRVSIDRAPPTGRAGREQATRDMIMNGLILNKTPDLQKPPHLIAIENADRHGVIARLRNHHQNRTTCLKTAVTELKQLIVTADKLSKTHSHDNSMEEHEEKLSTQMQLVTRLFTEVSRQLDQRNINKHRNLFTKIYNWFCRLAAKIRENKRRRHHSSNLQISPTNSISEESSSPNASARRRATTANKTPRNTRSKGLWSKCDQSMLTLNRYINHQEQPPETHSEPSSPMSYAVTLQDTRKMTNSEMDLLFENRKKPQLVR